MPGRIDSVFYFPQKFQIFDDVFKREGPTTKVQELFDARSANYGTIPQPGGIGVPPTSALVNFIDNHDVSRFLFETPDDLGPLHAALGYLLTEDGIPCIYYGTEQEFSGGNDPSNREPLWWSNYATDSGTFRWIARLTRFRREYEALRRGDFAIRWVTDRVADEQDAGILAFERTTLEGAYALVVINTQGRHPSETSASSLGGGSMVVGAPPGTVLVDVVNDEQVTVTAAGQLNVRAEPHQTRIFVRESDHVEGL
jgi:glycosidase